VVALFSAARAALAFPNAMRRTLREAGFVTAIAESVAEAGRRERLAVMRDKERRSANHGSNVNHLLQGWLSRCRLSEVADVPAVPTKLLGRLQQHDLVNWQIAGILKL
jgi:hypothetical protein